MLQQVRIVSEMNDISPFFISAYHKTNVLLVTLWRSDSTFMTSLFNKHPDIFYIPDLLIMAKPTDNKKTRLQLLQNY